MLSNDFEQELTEQVIALLWDCWSALGVAGDSCGVAEGMVCDPEAMLLATLLFGRRDARLFDEVLDWLVLNGDLVNVPRLHGLARKQEFWDDRLLTAVSGAMRRYARHRLRWGRPHRASQSADVEMLFEDEHGVPLPPPREPDPDFLAVGLLRERVRLRQHSRRFPTRGSAPLILRLRALIGVTSRCELLCLLATRPSVSGAEAAFLTGYSSRAVQEALADMGKSGLVRSQPLGKEIRYVLDPDALSELLPKGQLMNPPAWLLFDTLAVIVTMSRRCKARDASATATAALLSAPLDRARAALTRAGYPQLLSATVRATGDGFLEALRRDTQEILDLWRPVAATRGAR